MSELVLSLQVGSEEGQLDGEGVAARAAPATAAEDPLPSLRIEAHAVGDRVLVVLAGDVDIDTDQALQRAAQGALTRSASGVDLDLSGVEFCDCSGLNVLLRLRRRALEDGKTVAVRAASDPVERLLAVTHTRSLFARAGDTMAAVDDRDALPGERPVPREVGTLPDDVEQDLGVELVQLRRAMQTRPIIDLARGVLMASFRLSAEEAWTVLVTVSQRTNTKLHHVADELVGAVKGDSLPEPLQQELAAAVADHTTASEAPSDAQR